MAELKIISMDEVQSKEVNWLWYPYIPYGKITIIQGDPGEGKTTLALRLAALLSKGEALPYDDTEREPVKIIYQTAEDGLEDTIKPRLEAAEADCTQIKVIDESEAALSMLDERIEKAIIEVGARVVILDPIQAYVGANINMNNANEVRNVMAQLGRIAEKYDCAILLVGHMNKGSGNKSSYRGLGSIDFQASARSVLIVGRIKENPQVRVMVQDKSSLAPEGEAIAFELDKENGFSWLGHYDISVDDLLSGIPREKKSEQAENTRISFQRQISTAGVAEKSTGGRHFQACAGRGEEGAECPISQRGQSVVLGASRRNRMSSLSRLQHCKGRHICNLAMFLFREVIKFGRGCKGALFKGQPLPLGERKTCLQVAFLTGLPVKSAFALLSQKVTKARRKRRNGKEVILCKEQSAQWSEKAQSTTTAANSKRRMWTVSAPTSI